MVVLRSCKFADRSLLSNSSSISRVLFNASFSTTNAQTPSIQNHDLLYKRISPAAITPRASIVPILDQWVQEGKEIIVDEVKNIIKILRNQNRYAQALQDLGGWLGREATTGALFKFLVLLIEVRMVYCKSLVTRQDLQTSLQMVTQDPKKRLELAVNAVFDSWDGLRAIKYMNINQITGLKETTVDIQCMMFGNMGDTSGTCVLFTRNPSTGEKKLYRVFLINAQGEDVAGIRTPQDLVTLKNCLPEAYTACGDETAISGGCDVVSVWKQQFINALMAPHHFIGCF